MKIWLIFAFCFNLILGLEVKNSGNPLLFESVQQHAIDVAKTLIGGGDDAPIRTVRGYKSKLIKQRKEAEKKAAAAEEAAKKEAEEKARLEAEAEARAKGNY